MTAIEELRNAFSQINAKLAISSLGDIANMRRSADALERSFGLGRAPDHNLILKTLQKFLQSGALSGYREIKTACYGLLVPIRGTLTIASEIRGLETLLKLVDEYQREPKRLKRCFQAIMSAYFSLDGFDIASPLHPQWLTLRQRLFVWLPKLAELDSPPEWLTAAIQHRSLFGEKPTAKFGADVVRGETADFEHACEKLTIPQSSWMRRRVVISAIEHVTAQNDRIFVSFLDKAIALLVASPVVRNEGVAMLLNRYSAAAETPEHIALRSASLDAFGNPLLVANKPRWFGVSEEAQQMVATWLKGFLIERFFELLSHDGHTDKRRPSFWLRHRQSIENMWFVLGPSAMSSYNDDFRKLRTAMGNQCLSLMGSSPGNNAFVMKLGSVYVVEFGEKGNATYMFDRANLPFNLFARLLGLSELKSEKRKERLIHIDGNENWESKFSGSLARYGIRSDFSANNRSAPARASTLSPKQPASTSALSPNPTATASTFPPKSPASAPAFSPKSRASRDSILPAFRKFCNERGIRYDDRIANGRLVAYTGTGNSAISRQLSDWGFIYEPVSLRWTRTV